MIQSILAARSAVNERAEAARQAPAPSMTATTSPADAASPLDGALPVFGQHMAQLGEAHDPQAQEALQAFPEQVSPALIERQPELSEQPADAGQSARTPEESAAEQWLLGMLGQQQLIVGTREVTEVSAATTGAPRLPAGTPAPPVLTTAAQGALTHEEAAAAPPAAASLPQRPERQLPAGLAAAAESARNAPTVAATGAASAPTTQPALSATPAAPEAPAAAPAELPTPTVARESLEPAMAVERAQPPQASASEGTLRLQAPQARWGEQMLHALREHVDLQLQQKVQSATIRLDPPELGAMEILLSHESGRLTVQLTAAHADVARLLQQTSDRLRQELVSQHFVQVSVQVGADGQQSQHGQPRQGAPRTHQEPAVAGQLPADPTDDQTARGSRDVLVTV